MEYIKIEIDTIGLAYQQISNGMVIQYLNENGMFLFDVVPTGLGSFVIDSNPEKQEWMQ